MLSDPNVSVGKDSKRQPTVDIAYLSFLPKKFQVMFGVFCAMQVKDVWENNKDSVEAMNAVEGWLDGKVNEAECERVGYIVRGSCLRAPSTSRLFGAYVPSYIAFSVSRHTEHILATVCWDIANDKLIDEDEAKMRCVAQWNYYNELLHFDDIAERALLGEG